MSKEIAEFFTVESLCKKLQISKNTGYRLLITKQIAGFKIGRNWRIPLGSVESYINNQIQEKGEKQNGN